MFNTTKTIVAALAVAATVSLAFVPTATQAGGFSIGISSGDAGMTMSMGGGMRGRMMGSHFLPDTGLDEDGLPKFAHDEGFYEGGFTQLDADDAKIHINITAKGHTAFRQTAHDCLAVKKIELLITQMEDTLRGYMRIHDTVGIEHQQEAIAVWDARLVIAKADCAKGLY